MSRNQLTGQIPDGIPAMETLTTLDLSYNNFTGRIPTRGHFLDIASFRGNPYLCTNVSRPCSFINKKSQDHNVFGSSRLGLMIMVGLPAVLGSLLILLLVFLLIKVCTGRNIQKSSGWRFTLFQQLDLKVEDLLQCLKQENIIGKGGAGVVYRATMPSGLVIAIKQLVGSSSNTAKTDHGFAAEIKTLGRIKHRNIVRVLGYMSNNKDSNLLLYEYMPNGSLGKILHGENGGELQWERRYKIAVEAAKGLCYLHRDCSPLIIHRDVKSHNILLDSNFEAHVADFGLAKYFHGVAADCMSSVAGSFGYIAPGRKAVMNYEDAINIVGWVRKTTKSLSSSSSVLAVVDPNLAGYPLAAVIHLFKLAMLRVDNDSSARPTMREVVHLISNPPT
ncbi:receptor protein kinase CLAVATA1-like [Malus sylvestris]|uniref:receptor protein kinase CLAVATA1-like n=1 Tax=Malus sylvestris TaxID=3752 RepID=UPI0021ABF4BA|nr:receptor protein kinase CLAVATA1-like [Malus sylvestris]